MRDSKRAIVIHMLKIFKIYVVLVMGHFSLRKLRAILIHVVKRSDFNLRVIRNIPTNEDYNIRFVPVSTSRLEIRWMSMIFSGCVSCSLQMVLSENEKVVIVEISNLKIGDKEVWFESQHCFLLKFDVENFKYFDMFLFNVGMSFPCVASWELQQYVFFYCMDFDSFSLHIPWFKNCLVIDYLFAYQIHWSQRLDLCLFWFISS